MGNKTSFKFSNISKGKSPLEKISGKSTQLYSDEKQLEGFESKL